MKTLSALLRRSLQVHIALISLVYLSCIAFAIEPIGTIGQPLPEQHAFLSNETLLRVVPTHIQVVNPHTDEIIDEFGERIHKRTHVSNVVISPTAEHLAILNSSIDSRTTTVNIWDTNAREQISQWDMPGIIRLAAFSPTAPLFAISFDNEIQLWNWQTGEFIGKMVGERRSLNQCHSNSNGGTACSSIPRDHASVFTPDGRYLIVASMRSDIELWDIETRRLQAHFEGHTGNWVQDVVISPNGTRLASFERGWNEVYVWDVETQQLLWQEESGIGRIADTVFSPDSQHLYVASRTGTLSWSGQGPWEGWDDHIRVWDVESGKQVDTFGDDFYLLDAMALSPDGKIMLLHYRDAVILWDIENKQSLNVWADFVYGWVDMLSPDGQTFVSVSRYFIKTWDIPSQKMRLLTSAESSFFREFAISSDGQKIAIGRDPWIEVRNLRTGAVETQFQYNYGHSNIAFSSTGRWVVARGFQSIFLFDLENPEKLQRPTTEGEPELFTFSENDEYLAASTHTHSNHVRQYWIVLWKREADTFILQYAWKVPELSSHSRLAFASDADGSPVLAVPRARETQIWKLLPEHPELLTTLDVGFPAHFTADGRYLFAARERNLEILEWQTNTPLENPSIPEYFDVSRDSTVLLSYVETGQIQIWDGKALLPSQPVAVEPHDKQIVILGAVKRNQLLQNFPNPFNPETWIPFRLANESDVTIHIYATTGQLVHRLSQGVMPAGDYSSQPKAVYWDGHNQTGEPVSSGVYLYTINAGDFSATRKMLIRK